MAIKEGRYLVAKAIPIGKTGQIDEGRDIDYLHGIIYMDGGIVPPSYQEDFKHLIEYESKHGWNYLKPNNMVVGKSII